MMKFYYAPRTCALASHLALEQAGAQYEAVRLDFSRKEQRSAEYRSVNPKGRVPALITSRGVLTETPAILAWVAQQYPQAGLAPLDDPWAFAQMQAFNSFLCSHVHVAHAHGPRGERWVDDPAALEAMKRKVPQTMRESFELIEREMLAGPWVMGAQYTVADMYLFTLSRWLELDEVDITQFPKVAALQERMLADPLVARVLAAETDSA